MSRLVVVSNRVAPIRPGKVAAGGLAVGVYDALRQSGGIWFGWNGDVSASPRVQSETVGNITYVTLGLTKRDYDQYYRGFSNATLWPIFHYRIDLARYNREEYDGYRRVNAMLAEKLKPLLEPDDIIWIHDYHLIPFAEPVGSSAFATASASFCTSRFHRRKFSPSSRRTTSCSRRCATTTSSAFRPKPTGWHSRITSRVRCAGGSRRTAA